MYPLWENQDPAPRLYYCFVTVPPLSLHPLPSLLSNCLNLPLGTQGRPWRLSEVHFLRTRNGGHRKAFVPRSPTGPCSVSEEPLFSGSQSATLCQAGRVRAGEHRKQRLWSQAEQSHILALALPATGETKGFLSAARLALLPKTAYVVNVGRGSAIDQAALLDALNHDRLAGAALDVFEQEPIPAGDPAWTAKNLLITPHISGQMSLGYTRDRNVQLFCEDLERYGRGEKPLRLVDRRIGY